jgi:hypothetical protein
MANPDIACTLSARDLAAQAARWRRLRSSAGFERVDTEDGLRLAFQHTPAVESELRSLVAAENECCSWATWEVVREQDRLLMQVRSTDHGVNVLHAMFR